MFDVLLDGPKNTAIEISKPPGEIKEGDSVTLSCSSDANPAAGYTWFKDTQTLPWIPSQHYALDSVSSKDSGTYYCQAGNHHGNLSSNLVFIDVQCEWKTIILRLKLDSNNTNLYHLRCQHICYIPSCNTV